MCNVGTLILASSLNCLGHYVKNTEYLICLVSELSDLMHLLCLERLKLYIQNGRIVM